MRRHSVFTLTYLLTDPNLTPTPYCSFTFLLCLNFMSVLRARVRSYVLCELIFIRNVVCLLSCVNMCAFHVYFTANLLT